VELAGMHPWTEQLYLALLRHQPALNRQYLLGYRREYAFLQSIELIEASPSSDLKVHRISINQSITSANAS
jgi:hypothetical protein